MKKILTLILFGFMVTSCSNPKTEEEEVKVKSDFDSIGFIGEIANGNGIGFNRISEDQFTLETKGLETNYSISNGKVTEIVVNGVDAFENHSSQVKGAFNPEGRKSQISCRYTYDDGGSLVFAETNGQIFEKKSNLLVDEKITELCINNKADLIISEKANVFNKTFANGEILNVEKISDVKTKINIAEKKAISLDLDLSGNVIKEFDGVVQKNFTYDDYGNIKTVKTNDFSYELDSSEENSVVDIKLGNDVSKEVFSCDDNEKKYKYDDDSYSYSSDDYGKIINLNDLVLEYKNNLRENEYEQTHVDFVYLNNEELFRYSYDNLGNMVSESDKNENTTYAYYAFGQIIGWQNEHYSSMYSYDLRGNILEENENGKNNVFSYGDEDALLEYNDIPLNYDESYNLIKFGEEKFSYERGNVLTKYESPKLTINYDYDSNNVRKSAIVNGVEHNYYYLENKLISEDDGVNKVKYLYDSEDQAVGFWFKNQNFFYVRDAKQCIRYIIDGQGNVLVEYSYNPWGEIIGINDYSDLEISNVNRILYKGYYYDFETGLYYLISRYYSPKLHRFITRDNLERLSLSGSSDMNINLFAYANNNPIMKVDPMGYEAIVICGIVVSELFAILVGIVLIVSVSILTYYLIKGIVDSGIPQKIADALNQVKSKITKVLQEFGSASKKAVATWLLVWWKWWDNTYRGQYEVHHIIAQSAAAHIEPRRWLNGYGYSVNSEPNLARIKKILHKHLHTSAYYASVYAALYPFRQNKSAQFFGVLGSIKAGLLAFSNALPS